MKTMTADVKSARKSKDGKRETVAQASWPVYETLHEAVAAEGEKEILDLSNTQRGTNAKNAARSAATSSPSEKVLRDKAFMQLATTAEGQARLAEVSSDPVRFAALIDEIVDELKAAEGTDDELEAEV